MFSRSGNSFLIFLLSYHVRVTLKIKVNFRFRRYLKVTDDFILWIFTISSVFITFKVKEFIADIPSELLCLGDVENPSQLPV